ncbi:MAG: IclR family transcriptional regulator [Acidimicrobiales bacterium]|jgi:DNA-binding IclR family transcriptional regulator
MRHETATSRVSGPVERAFAVLQTVAAAGTPVGVRELGRLSQLPRSTAARLAAQLVDLGMLTRTTGGELTIGPAVATLRSSDGEIRVGLEDRLRPLLLELVDQFGESAALTVDTAAGAHYLAQIAGPSAVQVPDSSGASIPFHVVAPGLVLMSAWSDVRLSHYLGEHLGAATPRTVIDPTKIRDHLAVIKSNGFAWTDQQLDLEVNGVAVPVIDTEGSVVAAISLYGPAYRLNPTTAPGLGAQLAAIVTAAATIALG